MPKLYHLFKPKQLKQTVLFFLSLLAFPAIKAQTDSLRFLLKNVQIESPVNMREIVYIHTDKVAYLPGDTVYVAGYVLDRITHKLRSQSNTMWGVMLNKDKEPVLKERFLIVNGKAKGQFVLPPVMDMGIYQLTAFTNWQKNIGQEGIFSTRIEVKNLKTPTIRWGIEDLKKVYHPGDTVSLTVAIKNTSYEPVTKQRFEALWGEEKIKLISNAEGMANLSFVIPENNISQNTVQFSGYISAYKGADYMDESYSLPIPVKAKKADIQFMPESGYLVAGIASKVGFKAVDSEGNPIHVNGIIVDEKGNMITVVQDMHDGMGYLNMVPQKGANYTFRSFKDTYDFENVEFPKVHEYGISLKYTQSKNEIAYLQLLHNFPADIQGTLNINHSGFSYNVAKGAFPSGILIEVPFDELPAGIMRVTLFDNNQVPLAERLIFVNAHKKLMIEDWQNHRFIRTRKQSELSLTFKDNKGAPVKTHLSVSVCDSAYGGSNYVKEASIYSSLLLNSELKGNIHNPEFYFEGDRKAPYLDLLMITHGWRRFVWYETLQKNENLTKQMFNHDLVQGQVIKRDEPVLDAEVTFLSLSTIEPQTVKVNKEGKFWFKPEYPSYFMPDLMLKAVSEKYKERVELVLEPNDSLKNAEMLNSGIDGLAWQCNQVHLDKAVQSLSAESNYQLGDVKLLSIVNVTADDRSEFEGSPKDFYSTSRAYYKTYKDLDYMTDLASAIQEVAPGLLVDYTTGRASFPGRGTSSVSSGESYDDPYTGPGLLLVVDDFPRGKVITDYDYLSIDDILDITVLRGSEGFMMYGEQANEGIIIIRTRRNTAEPNTQSIYDKRNMAILPTYCAEREFYMPQYDTPEKITDPVPDLRTTIFWANDLVTDENGAVEIKWYNGDLRGTKIISVQAVGENGQLGSFTQRYFVR